MSTIVICICHVGRLEQHHNSNMLPTYVATKTKQTINYRKNFQFLKREIGIKSEKYTNKLELKKVWKDRAQ